MSWPKIKDSYLQRVKVSTQELLISKYGKRWYCATALYAKLAGYLDGEGYIGISLTTEIISVTNTDTTALMEFYVMFGGSISKRASCYGEKQAYEWKAHGPTAQLVRTALIHYLSRAKPQCQYVDCMASAPSRSLERVGAMKVLQEMRKVEYGSIHHAQA